MFNLLYSITRSSIDPTKLSLTVKGLLASLIPLATMFFGINVTDAQSLSDAIVQLVFDAATVYATAATVMGLFRKLYNGRWNHPDSGMM